MEEPRPGGTAFMITVTSTPGKQGQQENKTCHKYKKNVNPSRKECFEEIYTVLFSDNVVLNGKEKQIEIKATTFRKDQATNHQTRTGAAETDCGSRTDERDIENSPDATYREVTKLPNEGEKRWKTFVAGFWNVAGLFNKDRQFWKHIENYDAIGLTETWVDEKQWEKLKDKLPDKFTWKSTAAKRERTKERARGGIITGIRKGVKEEETTNEREDIQERRVILNNTEWIILTVFNLKKY
ncbi:hypothetical protein DBV15_12046 [Temnothorax longispinosus]|uniref:Uncharacterized protein n=1 Tax=Temnothorax longispinosus TaxID=300112 RepID=A0A4S2K9H6_9HYME|nr:hypothetical protein DBV15_12046 [Temnothorax longispinosus]